MLDFNLAERHDAKVVPINNLAAFSDAMRSAGLAAPSIVADGKLHRFTVHGDKVRSDNGWYVLHDEGDFAAGAFGSWKTGDQHKWCSVSESTMTEAERAEFRRRMAAMQEARQREEERVQAECREWCAREWSKAHPAPADHPYLKRKGIAPHGARLYKDSLMVPIHRDGIIVGMQFIAPDGSKTFKTGSKIKGGHSLIAGADPAILCEGFATGASIAAATGRKVIIAFTCGNLLDVAQAFRPEVVAADNDHKTDGNPGLTKGREAANAIGAKCVWPEGISGTDFNDLHAEKGIQAVNEYFTVATAKKSGPKVKQANDLLKTEFAPINWAIEGLLPEGLAVLSGPPKLGKSWLALDLCLSVVTGGMAAGQFPTVKGGVLMCAMEDNERRLKSRLQMRAGAGMRMPLTGMLDFNLLNDPDLTGFNYTTHWRRLDEGGLSDLVEWLDENPDCRLIVLDTLAKVKPEAKGKGNAYDNDYKDLGELQRLALERHCCILVITHNRKTESDDALQSISGSTGITGVMDTIMILKRGRSEKAATLFVTGRDVSEHVWSMQFDGDHGAWTVSGDAEEESATRGQDAPLQQELLDVIKKVFTETGRGIRLKDFQEEMGGPTLAPAQGNIAKALSKMEKRGDIFKQGWYWMPKNYPPQ